MFAVVPPGRELDPPEGDGTLERHFNGRLLHAVLPVERCVARRRRHAAEVPLNCNGRAVLEEGEEGKGGGLASGDSQVHFEAQSR